MHSITSVDKEIDAILFITPRQFGSLPNNSSAPIFLYTRLIIFSIDSFTCDTIGGTNRIVISNKYQILPKHSRLPIEQNYRLYFSIDCFA